MISRTILRTLCLLLVFVMTVPLLSDQVVSGKPPASDEGMITTYKLYFGDLHTHTGYSDAYGDTTPWDAYQAAIDAGADFMAVTDHLAIWHAYQGLAMDAEEWADTLKAADYFTSENFAAIAGYEAWILAQCGEINVYNTRDLPPAQPMKYRLDRLPGFYDWLAKSGAIGQWNHPLYMTRDFLDYNYYTESRDTGMNMIEVYNDMYYEDSYVKALDAGWHVMPTANSDTHYADWIAGHEMRSVLLAESLTPTDLYAAMSACRGYATLDKNLEIRYTLDGAVMGSTLSSADGTYAASIQIFDVDGMKDEITLIEIVSDGGEVVRSIPNTGYSVDLTIDLVSEDARYFFVRVTTSSPLEGAPGVTAWTAPVWTGK